MRFRDRAEAGKLLAEKLSKYKDKDVVVFAIPRGGVVLGVEIAKALGGAPLDLVITRKIGHPHNPEYALCVIAEDKHMLCNEADRATVDPKWLTAEMEKERQEAMRRRQVYLAGKTRPEVTGKIAIVVDDGIATGLTFLAALKEVRHLNPAKLVAAIPVMPSESEAKFKKEVDELVVLDIDPNFLGAVGAYYDNFPQVEDREVIDLLSGV